jgi:nucleoside-diphosphate-sugar epimerase/glycosyltransferase involved in cell wall biosynthesis
MFESMTRDGMLGSTERIIITGASGFLGSKLSEAFINQGASVFAIGRGDNNLASHERLTYYKCQLEEGDFPSDPKLHGADVLFHFAWNGTAPDCRNDYERQIRNIPLELSVLTFAKRLGVSKIVILGSSSEYAASGGPITGQNMPGAIDAYGAIKASCHIIAQTWAQQNDLPLVWVVSSSVYGPGRDDGNILTYTIKTLLNGEKPAFTSLEQRWDYIYIDDFINALVLIGRKGVVKKSYALGYGAAKEMRDYVMLIRNNINPALLLGIGERPYKSGKPEHSEMDISELQKDTGFMPSVPFENGIKETIKWFREISHSNSPKSIAPLIQPHPIDLAIVIPCYNEEEVLPETARQLAIKIEKLRTANLISRKSRVLLIDNGSMDTTWEKIKKFHIERPDIFEGIKLSKNCGYQGGVLCGLLSAKDTADAAISMDADLQDDIDAIDEMVEHYRNGCDIVYGIRSDRKQDSFLKRETAQGFYKFMKFLGVNIVYNHADFRLMSKNALHALGEYQEVNLFLRGIVPLLGFKTGSVYYSRKKRFAGKSKYPIRELLKFALEGITSFSVRPLRLVTLLGILFFGTSVAMITYFLVVFFNGNVVPGWATIVCSIWGMGGLILLSIGIVGEYIGKIYLETKHRPRYHIEHLLFEGQADGCQ